MNEYDYNRVCVSTIQFTCIHHNHYHMIIIIVNGHRDYYDHDDDRIDGKSIRIRFRSFVNIEKIAKQNQEKNR